MIPLKVLFAEDDRLDQLAFERFVEEHGLPITYLLAGSLNEAKCLVGQEKFDVIVVDYSLGDGTAMDLLPFAAGIPVILIAGTRDEEIAARAFTAGISDSLVKDIGRNYLEQLPERIEKAVGRRLRSVETLQENQALYRRVVDTANEGILVSDETHRTTFANRRMAELLGYTPEELLGRSMEEFIFPEDLADHRQRMSNRRQGVGEQYERRLRRRDGSTLWTSVSATPILENGEFRGSIGLYTDITERKRMEEALRESEEKYRALVENANEAIIVTQDGALKFANPKASELFGYSLQEAVGRPFVEFIHPDDRYLVAERYRKRLEGQVSTVVYPFRTIHKDGSIRWAEINSVRIAWEGRPAIMSYLSDITERKQAEEALRESEAKYRLLADNTVDGVWLLDMNLKLIYCSPSSEKQSGFTLQEIMEMSLEQYFTPESLHVVAESFLEEMPKVEADPDYNPILTLDLEFYKKDGTAFWAESKFSIVRDKHGKPVSILGLARDITERKQLEKALRESEAKYRSLVETAIEGVASIDLNGNLTFINDALCRMTGYTQDELLNKPFAGLLHPDDLPALMEAFLSEVAGTRTGPIVEFRGIPKTGQSIWFSTQPTAITIDGKIIGFNAILHDITERKRVEESLRESQKQFQALTETTSDFIWEMDVNGVYTYCSPQINELWGYKPEDMIGRRPFDLMVPEDRERAIKMFRTISESPRSFKGMETSSRDNTDRIVVLETSGVPFFDIDGRLCGYRGISRDITERKRVEESLRESEESFHSLFENSTIGLYRTTPDGRILLANPELCRMLGFPTFEELARRNLEEEGFTTEYSRQAFRQEIEEKGEIRGLESAWKRRDETILFVRESVHTVRDAEGSVLYYEGTVEDITERKRAEEALRESKERLELALIGGDLGFYDWDLQTGRVYTDERYLSMLGYVPGEIDLGWRANWEQQVHPDDLSFANYPVQSDLWGETLTYDEEYRMRHKSGEWVWVRDRSQITARAADGQPLRVTGIHENINERKRVEEALYFSNQRLELAQRSAGAGIWDWDITRQHLDWSRELFLLFGLDPDETEATFDIWHQVLHSDDREIASHRIDQAIADKIPLISEHRVIHPDGQVRWIRALGNTIYDPTGQPLRMAGICIDVTERKQAEEALQKSEALLNDVSEMARVGGWELDVETKQVLWTSETYRIHEIPEGEKIDLPKALLFFDLSQRSTLETALQRCVETGEGFDLELPFTSAQSRHLWTRALGRAVKADGKVVRLTGTFQDITERKQLEERIRQVRGDLLFAVSHDLKSPIQTLRQTQEMLSQLPPAEALARFQEYGEIWRRNLQRLERMINNLVDSQRGEEDRFPLLLAPCDPTELVKRVAEDLTGYALALQIQFDLKLEAVPEGSCDEETLARVVENLLTNAIKFSPQGGRVEVRLGMEGDTLLLEVEDHGAGIPSQEQEQLFQPFQRSRSAQQKGIPGTGLGLYVCRRIVEEHGGTITLTSREGQGTKVTVRLPWRVE